MKRIGVFAWADLDGRKHIEVKATDLTKKAFHAVVRDRATTDKTISCWDWQASLHDTVAEAASDIVRHYGIGWYSMAKRQLGALV